MGSSFISAASTDDWGLGHHEACTFSIIRKGEYARPPHIDDYLNNLSGFKVPQIAPFVYTVMDMDLARYQLTPQRTATDDLRHAIHQLLHARHWTCYREYIPSFLCHYLRQNEHALFTPEQLRELQRRLRLVARAAATVGFGGTKRKNLFYLGFIMNKLVPLLMNIDAARAAQIVALRFRPPRTPRIRAQFATWWILIVQYCEHAFSDLHWRQHTLHPTQNNNDGGTNEYTHT